MKNKRNAGYYKLMSPPRLAAALLVATLSSVSAAADKRVYIDFDANGCPLRVSPTTVDVDKRNDKIHWFALGPDGGPYQGGFEIIFDPFRTGPPLSTSNDNLKSPPVAGDVPASAGVMFKYSIKGKECGRFLDPLIRVL
jgi:hypothetical protein